MEKIWKKKNKSVRYEEIFHNVEIIRFDSSINLYIVKYIVLLSFAVIIHVLISFLSKCEIFIIYFIIRRELDFKRILLLLYSLRIISSFKDVLIAFLLYF